MSIATLPPPQTTSNDDGTQTVVFYRLNDAGKKVKVTRRVKQELAEASSAEQVRRSWTKYGEAAREQLQPHTDSEVVLRLVPKTANPKKDSERGEERKVQTKRVSCKYCGGDHLSFQCPLKDKLAMSNEALGAVPGGPGSRQGSMPPPGVPGVSGAGAPPGVENGKYVPPSMRAGRVGAGMRSGVPGVPSMGSSHHHDEATTLRISNLPETIQDMDLRTNFGKMGNMLRCNLVTNRATGRSRGFAFVVYSTREEAERARQKFDGIAAGNMIMHVDFAQPRE